MKMLRKIVIALLFCVLLCGGIAAAAVIALERDYEVTVSEAPVTHEVISPTSTRWVVKRGGRLIPISASRAKYFRVSSYHSTPFPANVINYVQTTAGAVYLPYQPVMDMNGSGYAPMYIPAPGSNFMPGLVNPPVYAPPAQGNGSVPMYIPAPQSDLEPGSMGYAPELENPLPMNRYYPPSVRSE
ncbi:MAG: hypothetical protein LBI74_06715 [Synergistaceae bacterium]|jgi:hypothetical protein|nr:hypothetical protein [Synergistaceae bacterium]